jgi:hypothetical protein
VLGRSDEEAEVRADEEAEDSEGDERVWKFRHGTQNAECRMQNEE